MEEKKLTAKELYEKIIKEVPKEQIDYYYSDLYVRATVQTDKLISNYEHCEQVSLFKDNIDNDVWYEIPFCNFGSWVR